MLILLTLRFPPLLPAALLDHSDAQRREKVRRGPGPDRMPTKPKGKKESASPARPMTGARSAQASQASHLAEALRAALSPLSVRLWSWGPGCPGFTNPSFLAEWSGAQRERLTKRARKKGAQRRYSATLGQLLLALPPLLLPVLAQVACAQPNRDISHQPATPVSPGLGLV